MSQQIDKMQVDMYFNSSQFEQGVNKTISALDKLKNSLNFDGCIDSIDGVGDSINSIDFKGMANSIEAIEKRFSTMGIVGMAVLNNLTNTAVNFVKRGLGKVTDAVIGGGTRRAFNIENARFQLQGLLNDEKKVQDVMDDAMWSVTDTAYAYDEAAKAASQFAASGLESGEKMRSALAGIAGVAAMTNSEYEGIARIFTSVAGNGRLMGDDLLQLSSRGLNAASTIKDYFNGVKSGSIEAEASIKKAIKEISSGTETTEADIRKLVTKGKISFDIFTAAMDNAFGEHAKKANDTFTGSLANLRAALSRIGADFVGPLIQQKGPMVEFFNTLKERINEVRAVLSPFAEEFGKTVNSIVESLTKVISNPLFSGSGKKSKVLTGKDIFKLDLDPDQYESLQKVLIATAKKHGIAIDEMIEKEGSFNATIKNGWLTSDLLVEAIQNFRGGTESSLEDLEEVHKLATEVIRGTWGDNWTDRINKLTEAGYSDSQIQLVRDYVNKIYDLTDGTWKLSDSVWEAADAELGNAEALANMSDEELKAIGMTDKDIRKLRDLAETAKETGTPLNDLFAEYQNRKSISELIIGSFHNISDGILSALEPIKQAWNEVFGDGAALDIYSLVEKFNNFTSSLKLSDKASSMLKTAFKGLFSIVKMGINVLSVIGEAILPIIGDNLSNIVGFLPVIAAILGGVLFTKLGFIFKIATTLLPFLLVGLGNIGGLLLKVTSAVGGFVTRLSEAASESNLFGKIAGVLSKPLTAIHNIIGKLLSIAGTFISKIIDKLGARLPEITSRIEKLLSTISNTKLFQKIIELATKAYDAIMNFLGNKFSDSSIDKGAGVIIDVLLDFIDGITNIIEDIDKLDFKEAFNKIKEKIVNGIKALPKMIHDAFLGVEVSGDELEGPIENAMDSVKPESMLSGFKDNFINALKGMFPSIFSTLSGEGSGLSKILSSSLTKFLEDIGIDRSGTIDIMSVIKTIMSFIGGVSIIKFLKRLKKIPDAISGVSKVFDSLSSMITAIPNIFKVFDNLGKYIDSFTEVQMAKAKDFKSSAMLKYAGAFAIFIGALVATVMLLGNMDRDKLARGVTAAALLAGIVGGILIILALIKSKMGTTQSAANTLCKPLTLLADGVTEGFGKLAKAVNKFATLAGLGILAAGIGAGILMIVIAFEKLMKVDWSKSGPAIVALIAIAGGLVAALTILKSMPGKVSIGMAASIIALALAIWALIPAVLLLGSVKWTKLFKGLAAVVGLIFALAGAIRLIGGDTKDKKTSLKTAIMLLAFAAAIDMLTISVIALSMIPWQKLWKGVAAVAGLMFALAGAMKLIGDSGQSLKTAITILAIAVALNMLVIPVLLLSSLKWYDVVQGVGGVTVLLLALSRSVSDLGEVKGSSIAAIIVMTGAVMVLMDAVDKLAKMRLGSLLKGVGGVAAILLSLSIAVKELNNVKVNVGSIIAIGVLALAIYGLSQAVKQLAAIDFWSFVQGIAGFVIILGGLVIAITTLGNMPPWGGAVAALNLIGFIGVILIAAEITKLIRNKFFGKKDEDAFDVLNKMAYKIGEIVGSFAAGASSKLPGIGSDLSGFVENADKFFSLNENQVDAFKAFVDMFTVLNGLSGTTVKKVLGGLFTTTTTTSLGDFGTGLGEVAIGMAKFANALAGQNFKSLTPEQINVASSILDLMINVQDKTPLHTEKFFLGLPTFKQTTGLGDFGQGMIEVGKGLAAYAYAVSTINFTGDQNDTASKIIDLMLSVQDKTPFHTEEFFLGLPTFKQTTGLGDFGEGMAEVGKGLATYVAAVKSINFKKGQNNTASKIIDLMLKVQDKTPFHREEFFLGLPTFKETTGLGDFGQGMAEVGMGLATYVAAVKTIEFEDGQEDTAEKIIDFMISVQDRTGITETEFFDGLKTFSNYTSAGTLSDFGQGMANVGAGLATYVNAVSDLTFDSNKTQAAEDIINFMISVQGKTGIKETEFFSGLNHFSSYSSGDTLGDFGKGMGKVGKGLAQYTTIVSGIDFDSGKTQIAEDIIDFMISVQGRTGIKESEFFSGLNHFSSYSSGDTLGDFGKGMGKVGKGLATYASIVSKQTFDSKKTQAAEDIIDFMISVQGRSGIKETEFFDGLSTFKKYSSGDTLGDFGKGMANVATGLGKFMKAVDASTFNPLKIWMAKNVLNFMVGIKEALPDKETSDSVIGVLQSFIGQDDLADFGDGMAHIATGLSRFLGALGEEGLDDGKITQAMTIIDSLAGLENSITIDIDENTGLSRLETFGDKISEFGGYVGDFWTSIKDWQYSVFYNAYNCIQKTVEALKLVPAEGELPTEGAFSKLQTVIETLGKIDVDKLLTPLTDSGGSFTQAASGIVNALSEGIQNADASSVTDTLVKPIRQALSDMFDMFVSFKTAGYTIVTNLKNGMTDGPTLGEIQTTYYNTIRKVIEACKKYVEFNTVGMTNATHFLIGLRSQNSVIPTAFNTALDTAITNINNYQTSFNTEGTGIADTFYSGLISKNSDIQKALSSAIGPKSTPGTALAKLNGYAVSFTTMGSTFASNLAGGMSGSKEISAIKTAASNMAGAAASACRARLEREAANKPRVNNNNNTSGPTAEDKTMGIVGAFIFGPGNIADKVAKTSSEVGKLAVSNIGSAIIQASRLLDEGIDTQPTIRPVLDLTDVNNGMRLLSGMFSGYNTYTVTGNVAAIASMRGSNQTVSNAEVVSAINNLEKSLRDQPVNSYVINGITYDDGSNITSAVKELIKAVRIEKRA